MTVEETWESYRDHVLKPVGVTDRRLEDTFLAGMLGMLTLVAEHLVDYPEALRSTIPIKNAMLRALNDRGAGLPHGD